MRRHLGSPRRQDSTSVLRIQVGDLIAEASSKGIGFSRQTHPRVVTSINLPSASQIAEMENAIGAQNLDALRADGSRLRAHDESERRRNAAEHAALDDWVAKRLQLLDEIDNASKDKPIVYVRQGAVSPGHASYNYRDNVREAGTSVTVARRYKGKAYILSIIASSAFFTPDHVCEGTLLKQTGSEGERLISVTSRREDRKDEIVML